MKNGCFRLLTASLMLAPLILWMGPLKASIDPSPRLHLGSLELHPDIFTTPEALKDNVVFWRRVFGEWHLNQVVLHDADYPALVYEVIDLDGKMAESLTSDQYDQIQARRDALEKRLVRLAKPGVEVSALSDEDRALRRTIIDIAGPGSLPDAVSRVRAQRGLRERFQQGLEISGRYDRIFRQEFREEGVPEDLVYLPHVESSYRNKARSSVGAAGMWQFTRSAGRLFLTVNRAVDQRMDPVAAARGAARYLRQAYEMLGDWPMAITSYNHGIRGMMRAKAQYGADFNRIVRDYDSKTFGFASRNFYAEFLAARQVAMNPDRYFPEGVTLQRPLALDSIVLDKPLRTPALARLYAVKYGALVALNPAWTHRAARGKVAIPAGTQVWLPAGTLSRAEDEQTTEAFSAAQAAPASQAEEQAIQETRVATASPVSVFHIVRANESLSTIAHHYGLSIETLRALNDIPAHRDLVRVGQKLRVRDAVEPVVGGNKEGDMIIHVVRKGDTPSVIAASYGISVKDLLVNNQLNKHSKLRPGQRLEIPVSR
jgi:membrane-bound lytic murein transglycosylase D